MSEESCSLCVTRSNGVEIFFLWESDGVTPDRVVLDDNGSVLVFSSEHAAREAAAVTAEPPFVFDFDGLEVWCKSDAEVVDCSTLLKAWNLFCDLPRGESLFAAVDARANVIYDELFRGCNLLTPPGESYVPSWSASEIALLKRVLLLGLAELRARLRSS